MQPVVYTIAHPLTNEIVYVGASKNFEKRKAAHLTKTNNIFCYQWVKSLREDCLLPRIEILDLCTPEDLMFTETYWINQLSAWGFCLFNKNQKAKPKIDRRKYYVKNRLKIGKEPGKSKHKEFYTSLSVGDVVTLKSRHAGEYLQDNGAPPKEETLKAWGKLIYKRSNELLEWFEKNDIGNHGANWKEQQLTASLQEKEEEIAAYRELISNTQQELMYLIAYNKVPDESCPHLNDIIDKLNPTH